MVDGERLDYQYSAGFQLRSAHKSVQPRLVAGAG